MTSSTRTAGRLPARVYWFRRALVLGTALALVFAFARLLGAGGGSEDPAAKARTSSARSTPTAAAPQPAFIGPLPGKALPTSAGGGAPVAEVQPDGPCDANDVTVTPVAGTAPAGRAVPLTLQLTGIRPACTFKVTPKTVVAKVSTAKGKVWSSQDCPASVSRSSVVVRSAAATTIQLTWNGRGSDSSCSPSTDWAPPGTYEVVAAAVGSEPSEADVKLTTPPRPVVVKTKKPKKPKKSATGTPATVNTGH
ncbi:hypothetical protein ABIE44_001362 [Marmoricola sp. OAE513]|uniref:hypothetical protein n=1 Tax=Marmoricola sp. OAE513 TaxID=2817894 RepID=UPI001AE2D44A